MMKQSLRNKVKVYVGIPNLRSNDEYGGYIGSVLNHLECQETDATVMKPYVTPSYAGKFKQGEDSKLDAITHQMNRLVEEFMVSDASHLFFNDGDVEIPVNCIDTLLRHDVDVASGVYPRKNFKDTNAMIFGRMIKDHPCGYMVPRDWDYMKNEVWGSQDEPWTGGAGCLLVKRRVFKPYHPMIEPIRFTRRNDCSLDTLFWKTTWKAGFTTRVDANIVCGHLPEHPLNTKDTWLG